MSENTPAAPQKPSPPPKKPTQPEWHEATDHSRFLALKDVFGDRIITAKEYADEVTLWIDKDVLLDVCQKMKNDGFTYLIDIVGMHYPMNEKSYTVVYYMHHMQTRERIRIKIEISDSELVSSVSSIWKTANWMEREAYDMLGINFSNHPDLRRILMWEGYNGHPLRKDFPLIGIDTGASIYPEEYPTGGGPVKK